MREENTKPVVIQPDSPTRPVSHSGLIATLAVFCLVLLLTVGMATVLLVKAPEDKEARAFLNELLHPKGSPAPENPHAMAPQKLPIGELLNVPGANDPLALLPEAAQPMAPNRMDQMEEKILQYFHDQLEEDFSHRLRKRNRHQEETGPSHQLPNLPGYENFFDSALNTMFLDIQETDTAYEIKLPLTREEDARDVEVKVHRRHIEISGKTTITSPNGERTIQTSTFSRMFTVKKPVDAAHVSRRFDGKNLWITIPKATESPVTPEESATPPARSFKEPAPAQPSLDGYI